MKSVLAQVETHREDAFLWLLYIKLFLALGVDLRESTVCALIDCCLENAKEQDALLFFAVLLLSTCNGSEAAADKYWRKMLSEKRDSCFLFGACVVLSRAFPAVLQRTDSELLLSRLHPYHCLYARQLLRSHLFLPVPLTPHCPVEAACNDLMRRFRERVETRDARLCEEVKAIFARFPFLKKKDEAVECVCGAGNGCHFGWAAVLAYAESVLTGTATDPVFLFVDSRDQAKEDAEYYTTLFGMMQSFPLLHPYLIPSHMSRTMRRLSANPTSLLMVEPTALCAMNLFDFYIPAIDWAHVREDQLRKLKEGLIKRLKYAFENEINREPWWRMCAYCLLYLGAELYLNGYEKFAAELNRVMRPMSNDPMMWTLYIVLIMNLSVFRFNKGYLLGLAELLKGKTLYLREQSIE